MPRPRKCRRVCGLPGNLEFVPIDGGGEPVELTVDEFETIRLIDLEDLSQEECGQRMDVARTTVQQIYTGARRKLAQVLVEGRPLKIQGGDYRICEGVEGRCAFCHKCRRVETEQHEHRGGKIVKIAIPVDDTKKNVCVSFGRAPYFLFKDMVTGEEQLLENPAAESNGGAGVQAAQFVVDNDADTLITVRCGENAGNVFKAAEVQVYKSQGESMEENLEAIKDGRLQILDHFHPGYQGIQ